MTLADPPRTISHQGRLTDELGNPIEDGSYELTCRIYDVPSGGSALWSEAQTITTTDGVYSVTLGEVTPVFLAFDVPYWLGISLEDGAEMMPRVELTSWPYAIRALIADDLDGPFWDDDWALTGNGHLSTPRQGGDRHLDSLRQADARGCRGHRSSDLQCRGRGSFRHPSARQRPGLPDEPQQVREPRHRHRRLPR
ncbi:MAG: hypothetical protein GF330_11760 [Candidatus Eisenbacteria bacterium]|nr:hypothetical protein [Candidatus Eisenbacteria bacterium]